jgi:uncharacterized membrane-anchored protein YjiN (DUF445 family)
VLGDAGPCCHAAGTVPRVTDALVVAAPADVERRRGLVRMKAVATGLLIAVAIVFLVARAVEDDAGAWVGYVRAFSEAAMVGALADWFAVTALFRHPLGVPIPHTAIIPNRKDQIGRSLGEFVQGNFLTHEVLVERVRGLHAGSRLGPWLGDPDNAERVTAVAADVLHATLEISDDRDVQSALEHAVVERVRATPVAPLLGRAIDLAIEGGHHERLLDAVLVGVREFLEENRSVLRARLEQESPWWIPEPIDERIFTKIYSGVHRFLEDVGGHPEHEVRRSIEQRIATLADRLRDDPVLIAKGEELKEELLDHPDVRAWLSSLWAELKRSLLSASADPNSALRQRFVASTIRFGERLQRDRELSGKIDRWLERAVTYLVDNYRGEVAELISSTVARWDARATSQRLELQVGRDLQFIRINGTIVGGLVGVLIHTLSEHVL